MRSMKSVAVLALVALLTACAGVDFVKPPDDKLVLGSTTKSQVTTLMGEPNFKGQKVSNGESVEVNTYAYAQVGGEAVFAGVTPARSVSLLYHNNLLVGKEYTSSFKADNTYFDPAKARSVKQGMKRSEVIALVGNPGGEHRYPLVANRSGKALVYAFTQTRGFSSQQTVLVVELDERDTVQKIDFNQIGQL